MTQQVSVTMPEAGGCGIISNAIKITCKTIKGLTVKEEFNVHRNESYAK